jgi:hypothetical protein
LTASTPCEDNSFAKLSLNRSSSFDRDFPTSRLFCSSDGMKAMTFKTDMI